MGGIENHKRDDLPDDDTDSWEDCSNKQVEHILPRTPTQSEWPTAFDQDGIIDADTVFKTNILGNLTLLTGPRNAKANNNAFSIKKPLYKVSGLLITQEIAQRETWDLEAIVDRQTSLSDLACQVWPG